MAHPPYVLYNEFPYFAVAEKRYVAVGYSLYLRLHYTAEETVAESEDFLVGIFLAHLVNELMGTFLHRLFGFYRVVIYRTLYGCSGKVAEVVSPEFKKAGSKVVLVKPEYDENGLPTAESEKKLFDEVYALIKAGKVAACYTPTYGGIAEAVMKMTLGNGIGFKYADGITMDEVLQRIGVIK